MSTQRHRLALSPLAAAGVVALACTLAGPARAGLASPVSVSLIAPGGPSLAAAPLPVTDSVDPAVGITVGDATAIGGVYMLPGESIGFSDHSIFLHVAGGAVDGTDIVTGFLGGGGEHARYEFGNLAFAGERIVGANILPLSGVISGTGGGLMPNGRVSFYLDELKFVDPGTGTGNAFGEFRIDLVTQAVPEPATWAMMLGGLALIVRLLRTPRRGV
jgi:hypothetical protein